MTLPERDVARTVLLAFAALGVIAARGFYLARASVTIAPRLWPWAFGIFAVLALVHAVALTSRPACLASGIVLHATVAGRLVATVASDDPAMPGVMLINVAFLAAILLSTALVWRHLLYPLTRRAA